MATTALTVHSVRTAGQVTLRGVAPVDTVGELAENFTLPAGFGDCVLLDATIRMTGIATVMTTPTLFGVYASIVTPAGVQQQPVGTAYWVQTTTAILTCFIDPDQARYWQAQEMFQIEGPDVDVNVAPTGDPSVFLTVRRLQP